MTRHSGAEGFGVPAVAKLPPVHLWSNIRIPPLLLELRGTPGALCAAIWQLITSHDRFGETKLLNLQIFKHYVLKNSLNVFRCKTFLKEEKHWVQISICPVGVTRPPIPTLVRSAAWSVIDQFPPRPNDSRLAPGKTTPSCFAFNSPPPGNQPETRTPYFISTFVDTTL